MLKIIMVISYVNFLFKELVFNKWWFVIFCLGFIEKIEILVFVCVKKKNIVSCIECLFFFFIFNRKMLK